MHPWTYIVTWITDKKCSRCGCVVNHPSTSPPHNQVVWAYLAVSAAMSLAVTYYYDAADNPKLHTILKWAMRLLGLGAVATSTTLPEASMTAAAALVGGHALWEAMGR